MKKRVYKNDLSLPRLGKGKFSKTLVCRELWKEAVKNNLDYKYLSYEEFYKIWMLISQKFKDSVIDNPLGVKAPFFIGEWKIQYLPYKLDVTDYNTSQELGEKVPFLNLHSKGKNGKLVWERRLARRYNVMLNMYAFEALQQGFRDEVNKALLANPNKYRISRPRVNKFKKHGTNN